MSNKPKPDFSTAREIAKPMLIFIAAFGLLMGDAVITASRTNGLIIALVWDVVLAGLLLGVVQWAAGRIKP